MRLLKLAIAIVIAIDAWHSESWGLMFVAALFLYQVLASPGCYICPTPYATAEKTSNNIDVEYEEVK